MSDSLRADLQRLFGHDDFRPGQREIVEAALAGRDTLAVLATGGGKSLTYQLPAMLLPGATLVLSPLIALMKDQAENLPPDVAEFATIINSSLPPSEVGRRLALVKSGRLKLIYAAPERLRQPPFLHALRQTGVSLVVVDEAHCISQWGHDFRPDYRAVGKAIAALDPRSVLAATATATPDVQDDIERQLGRSLHRIVHSTYRDNLFLEARKVSGEDEKLQATLELCQNNFGAGLVYAGSREKCEQLARMLKRHGVAAGFYHAGLPPEERARAQDAFMSGEVRVMAATVAFGMGVDKSDIQFLIHYHPSRTLENYYQEAGRAGRDGAPAHCTLLYSAADANSATRHLREDAITFDQIKSVYAAVREQMGRRRIGPIRMDALSAACGDNDALVRAALPLLEEAELIARHVDVPRDISLVLDWETEEEEGPTPPADWPAFASAAGGGDWTPVALSAATRIGLPDLEETLLRFQDARLLTYRAAPRDLLIELLPAPADTKTRLAETLRHRARAAEERMAAMSAYARDHRCRHGQIARYFGDTWQLHKCGRCDVCSPEFSRPGKSEEGSESVSSAQPSDKMAALSALQVVQDLAKGFRPFALGKAGLMRALRGAPDAPIKPERTSAFGALAALKRGEVERLIEALVETGYLRRDDESEYRSLYLTTEGTNAIAAQEIAISIGSASKIAPTAKSVPGKDEGNDASPEADAALLNALKVWRRATASEAAVPPFVVFADRVLIALAAHRPADESALLDIPGIGPAKISRYGDDILEIIANHNG